MDLIDFSQILELMKVEPGHGLVQNFFLMMIWLSSRGVKKEIIDLKNTFLEHKIKTELRLTALEPKDSNEPLKFALHPQGDSAHS